MFTYINNRTFDRKVKNFPEEVYRITDTDSRIFKLMYALLEVGIGGLQRMQGQSLIGESSLHSTIYNDLDSMFQFLRMPRQPNEFYEYNPYIQPVTLEQWQEMLTKDSEYRIRILKFFQALLRGGTLEGIKMMAEAACGAEVQVMEMWRIISGQGLGVGISFGRTPPLNNAKEFIIIPLEDISYDQRKAIIDMVSLIKPVNTVCTVHMSPSLPRTDITAADNRYMWASSPSHFFTYRKFLKGIPGVNMDIATWYEESEVEVPLYVDLISSDDDYSVNEAVVNVNSLTDTGDYNQEIGYLTLNIDDVVTSLTVTEFNSPQQPAFYIKIDDEIIYVTERIGSVSSADTYTYTLERGANATTAAAHTQFAYIYGHMAVLPSDIDTTPVMWGPWQRIPLADSPDNYPDGMYSGDPAKYDANDDYIYEWNSQEEFEVWFTEQVESEGGEILNGQFRLPLNSLTDMDSPSAFPEDALGAPEVNISTRSFASNG